MPGVMVATGVGNDGAGWETASSILLQVDLPTFGRNLYLIIGALILLTLVFFFLLALVIGVKILWFLAARRRAQIEHFRQTRRADGKLYPPYIEGVCEDCKRGGRKIYFPQGGVAMCPPCYEQWWREHDTQTEPDVGLGTGVQP